METVPLRGTDLKVSRIASGAWERGGGWGAVRPDAAIDAIRRAPDGLVRDSSAGWLRRGIARIDEVVDGAEPVRGPSPEAMS